MRYLTLLFTFLMGKYNAFAGMAKPQAGFFTEAIILKIRKMIVLFSALMIAAIGMSLTFTKSLELIGAQLDQPSGVSLSGALSGTLVGFVLFGALFLLCLSKKRWTEAETPVRPTAWSHSHRSTSPLEEAVALLVTDFVKEREYKRETKRQQWSERQEYYDRTSPRSYEAASASAGFGNATQPPVM